MTNVVIWRGRGERKTADSLRISALMWWYQHYFLLNWNGFAWITINTNVLVINAIEWNWICLDMLNFKFTGNFWKVYYLCIRESNWWKFRLSYKSYLYYGKDSPDYISSKSDENKDKLILFVRVRYPIRKIDVQFTTCPVYQCRNVEWRYQLKMYWRVIVRSIRNCMTSSDALS